MSISWVRVERFLPTPSARRATMNLRSHAVREEDFYPRPPRGGRHGPAAQTGGPEHFYPRPPRGGRPRSASTVLSLPPISTHALREEGDLLMAIQESRRNISTHALREEGDFGRFVNGHISGNFYPRPPRGGRPIFGRFRQAAGEYFYPRPPRGGRRQNLMPPLGGIVFLPTPSARRATFLVAVDVLALLEFLPTPSARRATIS